MRLFAAVLLCLLVAVTSQAQQRYRSACSFLEEPPRPVTWWRSPGTIVIVPNRASSTVGATPRFVLPSESTAPAVAPRFYVVSGPAGAPAYVIVAHEPIHRVRKDQSDRSDPTDPTALFRRP